MTCRELVDFLLDYLAGELPAAERVAFEAHLGECPDCVAYVRSYRDTVRLGKAACHPPDAPVPADVPEELVQAIRRARLAARPRKP
jgi:anti-sigma factor RsiW